MSSALRGKRVVNTRALHQACQLDLLLERRGAVPLSYPCIAIEPPEDFGPLDQALRNLVQGSFTWVAFSSANAAHAIATRLETLGMKRTLPAGVLIAAVGPATARAVLDSFGRSPRIIPGRHDGTALAFAMPIKPGETVLAPGSDIARSELAEILGEKGARVTSIVAFRTAAGSGGVDMPLKLRERGVDAITFSSPSAVEGFFERLSRSGLDVASLARIPVACIGDTTRETAERFGLAAHSASSQSLDGMLDLLEWLFVPVGSGGTAWS